MRLITLLLLLAPFLAKAQPCANVPGQNPSTAIPICGNSTQPYHQDFVAGCTGPDIVHNGCPTEPVTSSRSFWYSFHCYASGTLGFILQPNPTNLGDDYDWELFDITNAPSPNAVLTDASYQVSLNLFGNSAANPTTGCSASGTGNVNCGGNTLPFNTMPLLIAGHDYLLMVTNWTGGGANHGYSLTITGGTASLADPAAANPNMSGAFTGCSNSQATVTFNKPIRCSSVTPTGSEFSIMPGNIPVTSITSQCSNGLNSITQVTVSFPPLLPGNYTLVVNNGTDGNTFLDPCDVAVLQGSSVPFTVQPPTPATIVDIQMNGCAATSLDITFSKPILCNSVTPNGSEFSVSPGNPAIASVSSVDCQLGNTHTTTFHITFNGFLAPNSYTLSINSGTDGNTLLDTCATAVIAGTNATFSVGAQPAPIFDSVQLDVCNPAFVKAWYSHPIKCSSISPDGSDYNVTGPSGVNVVAASGDVTCASGYTPWVMIQFSGPINTLGSYVLHNKVGNDGNGVLDTCNTPQSTAETISFNASVAPSAAFTYTVKWGCVNDTIVLSHPGGSGVNSWNWSFSDNTTETGQTVTHIFPATTVSANVKLTVSNGQCQGLDQVDIPLDNAFKAGFTIGPNDTLCIGNNVDFTNTSTGNNLTYAWDLGDLATFNGQTPPTHTYTASGNYYVRLIATNNHACSDTARDTMRIIAIPTVDFTGLNSRYCSGNIVVLDAVLVGSFSSYQWDNGDNQIFLDKPRIRFSYPDSGTYTVKLSATDKYCGLYERSYSTRIYRTPLVQLGLDTAVCPNTSIVIGVPNDPAYTYLWNTGAVTPQISTDLFSRLYKLSVDNNGCRGADSVYITVKANCLIKVPNAFTPNNDGLNDQLKAVNSDYYIAEKFSFNVYNRFGNLVFSTNVPGEGWDGKYKGQPAETGTYVWQLRYTDRRDGKEVFEKGTAVLIR